MRKEYQKSLKTPHSKLRKNFVTKISKSYNLPFDNNFQLLKTSKSIKELQSENKNAKSWKI